MNKADTPFCLTIAGQNKDVKIVTVRDQNTGAQDRIDKSRVVEYLRDRLVGGTDAKHRPAGHAEVACCRRYSANRDAPFRMETS
jgi:hypothetical protein